MRYSVPHRCPDCMGREACGYNGILVREGERVPMCDHNEKPGKPCHNERVKMVPVDGRNL
jgi:hypothetical protein